MSSNLLNEDLRILKTKKSLHDAMCSLLKKNNFRKITIKGICEEALISRAAFYTHYIDKYDLLKHLIAELWPKNIEKSITYEQIEEIINQSVSENAIIIKNIIYDAENETVDILFDFILSTIDMKVEKKGDKELYSKNVVFSNFYAGGIIYYLLWQVKNKFPDDVPMMNKYFYEVINKLNDRHYN